MNLVIHPEEYALSASMQQISPPRLLILLFLIRDLFVLFLFLGLPLLLLLGFDRDHWEGLQLLIKLFKRSHLESKYIIIPNPTSDSERVKYNLNHLN